MIPTIDRLTMDVKHGASRYNNYGCRCAVCTAGNAERMVKVRQKLKTKRVPEHGYSGYTNYACRCDVCTQANSDYQKSYREQKVNANTR